MGHEPKIQQRWELRGCDDSDFSSGSSGSSSRSDPVIKKPKFVADTVPVENIELADAALPQQSSNGAVSKTVENTELARAAVHQKSYTGAQFKTVETIELAEAAIHQQRYTGAQSKTGSIRRAQTGKRKKGDVVQDDGEKPSLLQEKSKKGNPVRGSSKKPNLVQGNTKKHNSVQHTARGSCKEVRIGRVTTTSFEPAGLDELKLFRETLLEDIKVAREKLLIQMKEGMNKLVSDNPTTQLTRREDYICEKDIPRPNQNFRKNIQDQCQKSIEKNVQVQGHNRLENDKNDLHSNQSDKSIKVQPAKFKSSVKDHKCNGELSKPGKGKTVARDGFSQAVRTSTVKDSRGRRLNLPVRTVIQSDSFGQGYNVQLLQTCDPGNKLPESNSTIPERSSEGKKTVKVINIPHYLENNLDNRQDIGQFPSNKKNIGPRSLSVASDVLLNPSNQNGLRQNQINTESYMKLINSSAGYLEKFVEGKMTIDPGNCHRVLKDQLIVGQFPSGIPPNVRDPIERSGLNYLPNTTGQLGSSIYLTLPAFLSGPQLESLRQDSPCNYMQPSAARNALVVNPGRTDLTANTSVLNRAFPVMGPEGETARFVITDSINMNFPNHNRTPNPGSGTAFAVPFHEGIKNSLMSKDPLQASLDNSSQTTDKIESPMIK